MIAAPLPVMPTGSVVTYNTVAGRDGTSPGPARPYNQLHIPHTHTHERAQLHQVSYGYGYGYTAILLWLS